MRKLLNIAASLMACVVLSATTGHAQISPDPYVPCQEMPSLMQNYEADWRALTRFYTSTFYGSRYQGYGGIEGAAPTIRARFDSLYQEYLGKTEALDFNSLPQECKVDYILFKRDLKEKLRASAEEQKQYSKISHWFPFADSIYVTEKLRRRGHVLNSEALAKNWFDATKTIRTLDRQLKGDSSMDMDALYEAGLVIADLRRAITSIYEFYNGYDPLFTWWMPKTYKELDSALANYAGQFKEKNNRFAANDKSGIVGHPVGRAELIRQL